MMHSELFEAFKTGDRDECDFRVERAFIQPGRTFSAEALEELTSTITLFVGARIMAAWERRSEPPSVARVRVEVEVR